MLILSRKPNQKVVFPNLGVTVAVVSVQGNRVKLGIDAPTDVSILREELAEELPGERPRQFSVDRHAIRNRLNTIMLSLHVMQQNALIDPYEYDEAINAALSELEELNSELSSTATPSPSKQVSRSERDVRAQFESLQGSRRALVVEDNDHERSLLSAYLKRCGFDVIEAEDGQAAMRYLECNELPHVVLLDMNMPKLNGAETVVRIRHTPALQNVRVIGVSGSDNLEWKIPIGSRGVDRWFQKPVNPEKIVREIDDLVCV